MIRWTAPCAQRLVAAGNCRHFGVGDQQFGFIKGVLDLQLVSGWTRCKAAWTRRWQSRHLCRVNAFVLAQRLHVPAVSRLASASNDQLPKRSLALMPALLGGTQRTRQAAFAAHTALVNISWAKTNDPSSSDATAVGLSVGRAWVVVERRAACAFQSKTEKKEKPDHGVKRRRR